MRLVYLGTPQFAVPPLKRLVEAGHEILAVYTQPDRPKGRGGAPAASPVKQTALALGLPVRQPERIRRPEVVEELAALGAEAMAIVGYGQIIPQAIIDLAPLGIINVHASLLPKYRGAAPIQWSIARGETRTGVTTMKIDAGLDTGAILLQSETAIGPEEDAVQLGARLSEMGAALLEETLRGIAAGTLVPRPQDSSEATYAPVLRKEDGLVDWNMTAWEIANRTRGFQPWPGCYTYFRGQMLHIWRARAAAEPARGAPGTAFPGKRCLFVTCGRESCLEVLELQLEGRKRLRAEVFLNGQRLSENELMGGRSQ